MWSSESSLQCTVVWSIMFENIGFTYNFSGLISVYLNNNMLNMVDAAWTVEYISLYDDLKLFLK